jgi:hypothetical protein
MEREDNGEPTGLVPAIAAERSPVTPDCPPACPVVEDPETVVLVVVVDLDSFPSRKEAMILSWRRRFAAIFSSSSRDEVIEGRLLFFFCCRLPKEKTMEDLTSIPGIVRANTLADDAPSSASTDALIALLRDKETTDAAYSAILARAR